MITLTVHAPFEGGTDQTRTINRAVLDATLSHLLNLGFTVTVTPSETDEARLGRLSNLCILLSNHTDNALDRRDFDRVDLLEARMLAADNEYQRLSRI
jgi:hypothetical protein